MPTSKRADLSKVLPAVRCTARKQNGEPCRAMAARGANVCRVHGGSAPQVKAAAQRRLQQAAELLVERLLGFALDGEVPDAVALQAIRDALDRAGMGAKHAVEVGVELKPWEEVMRDIAGIAQITRAESRARQGPPPDEPGALAARAGDTVVIDAELVPAQEPPVSPPSVAVDNAMRLDATHGAEDESAPSAARRVPPPVSVTYEEAPAIMRASRIRTAPVRRARRPRRVR